MPTSSLLIDYITADGFKWTTRTQKRILDNRECRTICSAMKGGTIGPLTKKKTTVMLSKFFYKASSLIRRCQQLEPQAFWKEVGQRISWTKQISGSDLYEFSIKVIAARRLFHCRIDAIIEGPYADQHSTRRFYNKANDAVDKFLNGLVSTYGRYSKTRNTYYPRWTDDPDNEGTAKDTAETFKEKFGANYRAPGMEYYDESILEFEPDYELEDQPAKKPKWAGKEQKKLETVQETQDPDKEMQESERKGGEQFGLTMVLPLRPR